MALQPQAQLCGRLTFYKVKDESFDSKRNPPLLWNKAT